jgi:TatD DNase family protein
MSCDAHRHPAELLKRFPQAETERRRLGIACAASAWNSGEFSRHEALAAAADRDGAPAMRLCFAVHPQLPRDGAGRLSKARYPLVSESLETLERLAAAGRLAAVGETGFDLYDEGFRAAEKIQDELFALHLETALRYGLPVVLHVRRAIHKIFSHTGTLKKLPAVVFHSWPGVPAEGFSLLKRGVNAYFSFGTTILLNHKNAIRSCAAFPADRLLLETDAPYQGLGPKAAQGRDFSSWADLSAVLRGAADIRKAAGTDAGTTEELERISGENFFRVFGA